MVDEAAEKGIRGASAGSVADTRQGRTNRPGDGAPSSSAGRGGGGGGRGGKRRRRGRRGRTAKRVNITRVVERRKPKGREHGSDLEDRRGKGEEGGDTRSTAAGLSHPTASRHLEEGGERQSTAAVLIMQPNGESPSGGFPRGERKEKGRAPGPFGATLREM